MFLRRRLKLRRRTAIPHPPPTTPAPPSPNPGSRPHDYRPGDPVPAYKSNTRAPPPPPRRKTKPPAPGPSTGRTPGPGGVSKRRPLARPAITRILSYSPEATHEANNHSTSSPQQRPHPPPATPGVPQPQVRPHKSENPPTRLRQLFHIPQNVGRFQIGHHPPRPTRPRRANPTPAPKQENKALPHSNPPPTTPTPPPATPAAPSDPTPARAKAPFSPGDPPGPPGQHRRKRKILAEPYRRSSSKAKPSARNAPPPARRCATAAPPGDKTRPTAANSPSTRSSGTRYGGSKNTKS